MKIVHHGTFDFNFTKFTKVFATEGGKDRRRCDWEHRVQDEECDARRALGSS